MRSISSARKNKHLILDQIKLKKAQKVLGARTETETIYRALEQVISEDEKNRRAWAANERFIRDAIRNGVRIVDAFGHLDHERPDSATFRLGGLRSGVSTHWR